MQPCDRATETNLDTPFARTMKCARFRGNVSFSLAVQDEGEWTLIFAEPESKGAKATVASLSQDVVSLASEHRCVFEQRERTKVDVYMGSSKN